MTPIDIPDPAEIAERNRVADEAADDNLLEEWLAEIPEKLLAYRGQPIEVPLPGCVIYHAFGRVEVIQASRFNSRFNPPWPRNHEQFTRKAVERVAGLPCYADWVVRAVRHPRVQPTYGRNYDHTTYPAALSFTGIEEYEQERKERNQKEAEAPPKPRPTFLRKLVAYLADREP